MIKAIIYTRVSSKEQEKEGYSIPAQMKLARDYAAEKGFEVINEYKDAETAKKVGRTSFQLMLDNIRQGEATVLLVEKTDRLTRNFKDYVEIDDLINTKGLEVHLIKEGEILGPNAKSHTKLIHGIKVVLAKNYIDNLSEEIRKGLHEKASQGWYPHKPPYGYKGQDGKIIVVPEKANLVKRLFELYASGQHTFETLPNQLLKEGYTYLPSNPRISSKTVEKILKNPFYKGYFNYGREQYQGKHEIFIPLHLINQVDSILNKRSHKETERSFLFQGLITCCYCGCVIVGEIKKGKYIYYHCSNGKGNCKKEYVREEVINEVIENLLIQIQPDEKDCEWLKDVVQDSRIDEQTYHEETLDRLQAEIKRITHLLDRIYDDFLESLLDETTYRRKRQRLIERNQELMNTIEAHQKANIVYQDQSLLILELVKNAYQLYSQSPKELKRELLKILLSNFTLQGKETKPELHYAFTSFVKVLEKRDLVELRAWLSNLADLQFNLNAIKHLTPLQSQPI